MIDWSHLFFVDTTPYFIDPIIPSTRSIFEKYHCKGVRKEQSGMYDRKPYYNRPHSRKKFGLGVRIDTKHYTFKRFSPIYYYRTKKTRPRQLYVNRPCLCGSIYHSLTTHTFCPLNPKYDDAIEWCKIKSELFEYIHYWITSIFNNYNQFF